MRLALPMSVPLSLWGTAWRRRWLKGAACAIGSVTLAYWLTRLLGTLLEGGISPLFFIAVMVTAFVGGLTWGLVATLLATICTAAFFMPAGAEFAVGWDDAVRVATFIGVAMLVSWLQSAREVTLRNLERAKDEAEAARAEAVAASGAKDRFLNILSHELRNPLNPIVAAVSLRLQDLAGRDDPHSRSLREDFELIRRNAEAEARLIDDLLDSGRIRTGKLRLLRAGVDLAQLAEDAIESARPNAASKGLELQLCVRRPRDGETWLTPIVDGDSVRLRQVLWNLLNNAIKFTPATPPTPTTATTPSGGVRVTITPSVGRRGVVVAVGDSGVGIDADEQKSIFEPFTQARGRDGDSAAAGGLGLGLSIARGLVAAHGGTLRLRSVVDRGSVFRLRLPAVWCNAAEVESRALPPLSKSDEIIPSSPPAADAPTPAKVAKRTRSSSKQRLRILLVEDHADTARVTRRLLARRNWQTTWAASLAEALRVAEAGTFDLIISDIGLGDGSGCDLMTTLRERYPDRPLRAIAVSGYATPADIARSHAAGFDAHLVKPIAFETLCEQVERLTKQQDDAPAWTAASAA